MIPCKECLKLAICRHKQYSTLLSECNDITLMLYTKTIPLSYNRRPEFESNIFELDKIMKPSRWYAFFNSGYSGLQMVRTVHVKGKGPMK